MDREPVLWTQSCSWCRTMNRDTERWCRHCGHAAHRPRLACNCLQCQAAASGRREEA